MSVKMLNTTSFVFLMQSYANCALRDPDVCRFDFDGERVIAVETSKMVRSLLLWFLCDSGWR